MKLWTVTRCSECHRTRVGGIIPIAIYAGLCLFLVFVFIVVAASLSTPGAQ